MIEVLRIGESLVTMFQVSHVNRCTFSQSSVSSKEKFTVLHEVKIPDGIRPENAQNILLLRIGGASQDWLMADATG